MQQGSSCPQCGAPLVANQQFCGICGTKLGGLTQPQIATCPQCGNPLTPGQQFCATCGTKISGEIQQIPVQPALKPVPQQRSSFARTVSVSPPPQVQQVPVTGQVPPIGATRIKNASISKPSPRKYGLLRLGAIIFQILGWIVLVGGIVASIGIAVFVLIGGQLMPLTGGTALTGGTVIISALVGLILSVIYGIAFLAVGQLFTAVADLAQKY